MRGAEQLSGVVLQALPLLAVGGLRGHPLQIQRWNQLVQDDAFHCRGQVERLDLGGHGHDEERHRRQQVSHHPPRLLQPLATARRQRGGVGDLIELGKRLLQLAFYVGGALGLSRFQMIGMLGAVDGLHRLLGLRLLGLCLL